MSSKAGPSRASGLHPSKAKLLEAATLMVRAKGYNATRIEDLCAAAGVTKGSFFHHFKSKEELAVAAAEYWAVMTGALFADAPYHRHTDPLDRVLSYVDFRKELLEGELPEITCLVGTMVQEIYETEPQIRDACERSMSLHVATLEADLAEAKAGRCPLGTWTPSSLALHTQAVIQGAFILAKARGDVAVAAQSLDHLRRYIELLFAVSEPQKRPSPRSRSRLRPREASRQRLTQTHGRPAQERKRKR